MKGEKNSPGQPYRPEDFNNMQGSLETGIRERFHDSFEFGIVQDSQFSGETIPFKITRAVDNSKINIGTGLAYAPQNSISNDWPIGSMTSQEPITGGATITGNERILIKAGETGTWSRTLESSDYVGTGPFKYSIDGLGGKIATPQSSGTQGIPVPGVTGTCYVWLGYLNTTDATVFSEHKVTSQRIYYKKMDGYDVRITSTIAVPDSDPRYFLIGTFNASAGVCDDTTIDQSMAPIYKTRSNRVGIFVGSTGDRPSSYSAGVTGLLLDDHINGIGSGEVTAENVHGLAAVNLDGFGYSSQEHARAAHTDGIHGTSGTIAISVDDVSGLGLRIIRVSQLAANEFITLDGDLKTEIYPMIGGVGATGDERDAYIDFDAGDTGTNYNIYLYLDGASGTCDKMSSASALPDSSIKLGSVSWDSSGAGTLTITSDDRALSLGMVSGSDIQPLSISSYKLALADGGTGQGTTYGNGIKTNHIVDLAVTNAKIAGPIDANKIASGITAGQISSINANLVSGLTAGQIASVDAEIIINGITAGQITDNTINYDNLDAPLQGRMCPTGSIIMWPKLTPPAGWLNCDGAAIPGGAGGAYNDLIVFLSSLYTPNMTDRFPLSKGSVHNTIAVTGGAEEVTLTAAQSGLPDHTHTYSSVGSYGIRGLSNNEEGLANGGTVTGGVSGGAQTASAAHSNMPPYFVINFIIKT